MNLFLTIFFSVSTFTFVILSLLSGFSTHMGNPDGTNWGLILGLSVVNGMIFALVVQGIVSLF